MYTLAPSCHGNPVLFTWRVPSWRGAAAGAREPHAVPRDVHVGAVLPREPRAVYVEGAVVEGVLVVGGAGVYGDVFHATHLWNGEAQVAALGRLLAEEGRRRERVAHEKRVPDEGQTRKDHERGEQVAEDPAPASLAPVRPQALCLLWCVCPDGAYLRKVTPRLQPGGAPAGSRRALAALFELALDYEAPG